MCDPEQRGIIPSEAAIHLNVSGRRVFSPYLTNYVNYPIWSGRVKAKWPEFGSNSQIAGGQPVMTESFTLVP
jgi:hypothetical protein